MQSNGTDPRAIDQATMANATSANMPNGIGIHSPRPPIHEAVNSAFDHSDAASRVDPNLVAQITKEVISSLKASGITGASTPQQTPQQKPQSMSQPIPTMTSQSSQTLQQTPTPTPQPTPQQFPQSPPSQPYQTAFYQPTPLNGRPAPPPSPTSVSSSTAPGRYTPPSPNRHDRSSMGSSSPEPAFSETASYASKENKSDRRDSKASASGSEDNAPRARARPVRVPSSVEETTLEKIWQPLFDNGRPTPRLSQFLRGLAIHLIEDCIPKKSIVVTPGKLANYFEATKITDELYPWNAMFGGKLTNASISRIYRELRCQHHLVQFNYSDQPSIPGLTPLGFEQFMTVLIQAHPDHEFERLTRAVLDMPISNAENPKERFPKELSRRLFPRQDDVQQQQRLTAAISADPAIQLNRSNPMPPPPPTQPPPMPQNTAFSERERNPYSNTFTSAIDDDDLSATPVQIERERKPYTAKEGTGKYYDNGNEKSTTSNGPRPEATTRQTRANTTSQSQPPLQSQSFMTGRPTDIPNSTNRSHRMSMNVGAMRYGTSPAQVPNHYTRSEGTNINEIPAYQYASNMHDPEDQPQRDPRGDPRRFPRRQNTDDEAIARGFGYGPRQTGGTFEHPPSSSYGMRGPGGTDGYGSFPNSGYVPPPPTGPRY